MLGLWAEGLPGQSWGTEVIPTMSEGFAKSSSLSTHRMPTLQERYCARVSGSAQTSGQGICRLPHPTSSPGPAHFLGLTLGVEAVARDWVPQ